MATDTGVFKSRRNEKRGGGDQGEAEGGGIGERGRGIILCIKSQRAKYHRTLTRERGRGVMGGGREHER